MSGENTENGKEKKKGFFSKVLDVISIEEEGSANESKSEGEITTVAKGETVYKPVAQTTGQTTGSFSSQSGVAIEPELLAKLKQAITGRGRAYELFVDMANSLSVAIPDEVTRLKSALIAVGTTGGLTIEQILEAIDERLAALEEQKEVFDQKCEERKGGIKILDSQLRAKDEQIAKLKAQIAQIETDKNGIRQNITSETAKVEKACVNFDFTLNAVKEEILTGKEKINQYLKKGG